MAKRPPNPATYQAELTVLHALELGATFADDFNQKRYFLDSAASVEFLLEPGQLIQAEVNVEGYVLEATLVPRHLKARTWRAFGAEVSTWKLSSLISIRPVRVCPLRVVAFKEGRAPSPYLSENMPAGPGSKEYPDADP
jgi:hypothetical protein